MVWMFEIGFRRQKILTNVIENGMDKPKHTLAWCCLLNWTVCSSEIRLLIVYFDTIFSLLW